jgi:hypothetical protein
MLETVTPPGAVSTAEPVNNNAVGERPGPVRLRPSAEELVIPAEMLRARTLIAPDCCNFPPPVNSTAEPAPLMVPLDVALRSTGMTSVNAGYRTSRFLDPPVETAVVAYSQSDRFVRHPPSAGENVTGSSVPSPVTSPDRATPGSSERKGEAATNVEPIEVATYQRPE